MRQPFAVSVVALLVIAVHAAAQDAGDDARREAIRHYRAGQELLYAEQWEHAAQEFGQAVQLDPLLTLAHYGLGQAEMGMKDYPGAVRAYTACREAFRQIHDLQSRDGRRAERLRQEEIDELKDSLSLIQSGSIKYVNSLTVSRIENRIRDLERSRQRDVNAAFVAPAEVSLALGSAYFRSGSLPDAEREYRAAIDANPKMGEAHNNLAVICLLTKRFDDAESEVKLAEKAGFKVNPQLKADIKKARQGDQEN